MKNSPHHQKKRTDNILIFFILKYSADDSGKADIFYSFSKCLNTCYVQGTILGTELNSSKWNSLCSHGAYLPNKMGQMVLSVTEKNT